MKKATLFGLIGSGIWILLNISNLIDAILSFIDSDNPFYIERYFMRIIPLPSIIVTLLWFLIPLSFFLFFLTLYKKQKK